MSSKERNLQNLVLAKQPPEGGFSTGSARSPDQELDIHDMLRDLSNPNFEARIVLAYDFLIARALLLSMPKVLTRGRADKGSKVLVETEDLIYEAAANCGRNFPITATRIALRIAQDEIRGEGESSFMYGHQLNKDTGNISTAEAASCVRRDIRELVFDKDPTDLRELGANLDLVVTAYERTVEDIKSGDIVGSPKVRETVGEINLVKPFWDCTKFTKKDGKIKERFECARKELIRMRLLQEVNDQPRNPIRKIFSRFSGRKTR